MFGVWVPESDVRIVTKGFTLSLFAKEADSLMDDLRWISK